MNYVKLYKLAIQVFQQYGIPITGQRKFASFHNEHKMDRVFVLGLIYEMELISNRVLYDDEINLIDSPAQLLEYLKK